MKTCIHCRNTKPLTEFYRHPAMADGRLNACKTCKKGYQRKQYRATLPDRIAYDLLREKRAERKAKKLEYQRSRRARRPEAKTAYEQVRSAIRRGELVRQPCIVCKTDEVEAHHEDHHKALDVQWLCRTHHMNAHGKQAWSKF